MTQSPSKITANDELITAYVYKRLVKYLGVLVQSKTIYSGARCYSDHPLGKTRVKKNNVCGLYIMCR